LGNVAAVIVDHASGDVLRACIGSLEQQGISDVVVVDNASRHASANEIGDVGGGVRLLRPGTNLGYGAGVNRGVAASVAPFILIANPDLLVHAGAVKELLDALDSDPLLAAVGPRTLRPDGSRYPSARRFPSAVDALGHAVLARLNPENRFSKNYRLDSLDLEVPTSVDWISGACMLVRRAAFEEVGGFDESYFMYAEDMDLCWRLRVAGWQIAFVPAAIVTHQQGTSTSSRPYRMLIAHHRSALRFEARTSSGWRRALLPGVAIFMALRLVGALSLGFLSGRFRAGRRAILG
jgi:N-acetylglucosaminyl-diphospho-decaprenol L-rhamnosyltransferase